MTRDREPQVDVTVDDAVPLTDDLSQAWRTYALTRIQQLVDRPREEMSDEQLSVYTFAANALAGGDPVIAVVGRGPGHRLCRVCLAEWSALMSADHAYGCPVPAAVHPGGEQRDE